MRSLPPRFAPLYVCLSAALLALLLPAAHARAQNMAASGVAAAALEREMIAEINFARTRPAEYAALLEGWRAYYSGNEFRQPGKRALTTAEGVGALEEAVRALRATRPLGALDVSKGMCSGAAELVKDQGASGVTGHRGGDGSFCEQRVARFGSYLDPIGENLSYGDDTARDRVFALLVDDGFATRGHRKRLLDPSYKVVGVACGAHKLGPMCVVTLAGGFNDRPSAAQPGGPHKTNAKPPSLPAGAKRL